MLIKRPDNIRPSEITSEQNFHNRRAFLRAAGIATLGTLVGSACAGESPATDDGGANAADRFSALVKSPYSTDEAPNSFEDITTYNNFYEFGTDKADPHRNARDFQPLPWQVKVSGECDKRGVYDFDDILGAHDLEERIYRLRCVEAWSMVVPWVGFPLADLVKRLQPNSKARYVTFRTLHDPKRMPGQRRRVLDWPYVEGLTIAEATHPLTLMVVGVYGRPLPNQNGAPLRLIVPWKYGFKSIKSINEIHFSEQRPRTSWENAAPQEYGFYANVNPEVDHPRWSQARERRIGTGLFAERQPTKMFNGYGEQVAHLYAGLDLARNY